MKSHIDTMGDGVGGLLPAAASEVAIATDRKSKAERNWSRLTASSLTCENLKMGSA